MEKWARLERQMAFIRETDKIKDVFRQTQISTGQRFENDAEHSWHITLMAFTLAEHANVPGLDMLRMMKMLVLHDIVEIDAGDTFAYDVKGNESKREREVKAADRIFGLLPPDQEDEFRSLWEEFDAMQTPESRFAAAMDRLQPMMLNYINEGGTWNRHQVTLPMVVARNRHIAEGGELLWRYAVQFLQDAVAKGWLDADGMEVPT